MPRKSFIIVLFILFPLVVGLACLSSRPDPTATPTEEPVAVATEPSPEPTQPPPTQPPAQEEVQEEPTQTPKDLVVLEKSAWYQEGSTVFTGYLIENPTRDILFEDVEFTIRLFGASGNLIDTSYSNLTWFFPNTTRGVVAMFYLSDENVVVDSVDIAWTFKGTSSPGAFSDPFTTENLIYWDNDGFPQVTGKIVNNESTTYTDLRTDIICYDSSGVVVGGGTSYLDFIHLNDYMGFIAYVDSFGDVDRVEAFTSFSYSTKMIDRTDFSSDISVLQEDFYVDNFGYPQGGMIIQNETDDVLRSSVVYITFYDENDNITTAGSSFIDLLLPNSTLGVAPWLSSPPTDTNSVRYDILMLPGEADPEYVLETTPFMVNSTSITGEFDNYVLVNFTNTYSKQASEVDVFVLLFNEAGAIIGGGDTWTSEPTPAGGTAEIEVWVSYSSTETIDSVQAWAVPSFWTVFE